MLHVEDTGNPDGPAVLMLHGFMSSNHQWEPNRPELGSHLRLLMTEQPGHGGSPGPDDLSAYRADAVLEQLDEVRADRGIERLWLVGQSLGGAVCMRYAFRFPDRVAGLVFTNSRAIFGLKGKQPDQSDRDTEAAEPTDQPEYTREQIRAMPYHPINAKRIPEELKTRMVAAADAMPSAVFRHLPRGGPWQSSHELHRLQVPTLLINGRFEKAFQPCVDEARAGIADLQVVDLDGGHSVNIDQPEAFNKAVLEFIVRRPK
ncbi:MAG: alpha/beta fold hydrolase [Acidimicrobiales bacterium]